jgi:hypothetical protein
MSALEKSPSRAVAKSHVVTMPIRTKQTFKPTTRQPSPYPTSPVQSKPGQPYLNPATLVNVTNLKGQVTPLNSNQASRTRPQACSTSSSAPAKAKSSSTCTTPKNTNGPKNARSSWPGCMTITYARRPASTCPRKPSTTSHQPSLQRSRDRIPTETWRRVQGAKQNTNSRGLARRAVSGIVT